MNELALCVINTGKHYSRRCDVARFSGKADRMNYWRDLARNEAVYQVANFDLPRSFSCEEINQAAVEIEDYMRRHIQEWTKC